MAKEFVQQLHTTCFQYAKDKHHIRLFYLYMGTFLSKMSAHLKYLYQQVPLSNVEHQCLAYRLKLLSQFRRHVRKIHRKLLVQSTPDHIFVDDFLFCCLPHSVMRRAYKVVLRCLIEKDGVFLDLLERHQESAQFRFWYSRFFLSLRKEIQESPEIILCEDEASYVSVNEWYLEIPQYWTVREKYPVLSMRKEKQQAKVM